MLTNILLTIIAIELFFIYTELKLTPYPKLTLHQLVETHSYTKYLSTLLGNIFGLLSIIGARVDYEKTLAYAKTLKDEANADKENKTESEKQNG